MKQLLGILLLSLMIDVSHVQETCEKDECKNDVSEASSNLYKKGMMLEKKFYFCKKLIIYIHPFFILHRKQYHLSKYRKSF